MKRHSHSLLDAIVSIKAGALPERIVEDLGSIPGVKAWGAAIETPRDAVGAVLRTLEDYDRGWEAFVPPWPAKDVRIETAKAAVLTSELHDWLWEDDSERIPTAGFALKEYQKAGIAFVLTRGSGTLWCPPGSGKTIMAWAAALAKPGAVLCVTKAGARDTHERELLRCSTIQPWVALPVGERPKGFDDLEDYIATCKLDGVRPVVIVGWEQLPDYRERLKAIAFQTVIWDEIHKAKNKRKEKWRIDRNGRPKAVAVDNIVAAAFELAQRIPRRIATTATAVKNLLSDLWMQLVLVSPGAWGRTASRFEVRYCEGHKSEAGYWTARGVTKENLPELVDRLKYSVFRVPYDVVRRELPPKRRMVLRLRPDELVKPIARTKEEMAAERSVSKRERQQADAASAKRQVVYDLVEEHQGTGKGKIIVFSCRQRDVDYLGEQIKRRLKIDVWASHGGGHTIKERRAIQDAYMAHPGPCVLVASVAAWGESLNLQDTDVIIVAMLPDTPGEIEQLEGRGERLGMDRPLLVIYPIAPDTYDEHAGVNLVNKLSAVEGVASSGSVLGLRDTIRGLDQAEQILEGLSGIFNMDADESEGV